MNETWKAFNEIQPTDEITINENVFDSASDDESENTKDYEDSLVQKGGIENAAKIDILRVPIELQNKVKEDPFVFKAEKPHCSMATF